MKPKTMFSVHGPFKIACCKKKGGRSITPDNKKEFWKKNHSFQEQRGCYVFAIRASKGYTPWYVGKTTKGFKQEIFADHKLKRYHESLSNCIKGSPVFFFLTVPLRKGALNRSHIKELEIFLIDLGDRVNPELSNIKDKKNKKRKWGITGVIRYGKGKPTKASSRLRKLFKL